MWQVDACIIAENQHDDREHLMQVVEQQEHVDHEQQDLDHMQFHLKLHQHQIHRRTEGVDVSRVR